MDNQHWANRPWAIKLGLISAIISLLVFFTGKQSIIDFLPSSSVASVKSTPAQIDTSVVAASPNNQIPYKRIPISNFGNCQIIAACFKRSDGVSSNGTANQELLLSIKNNGASSAHIIFGGFNILSSSNYNYKLTEKRTNAYSEYPYFIEKFFEFININNKNGIYLNPNESDFNNSYKFKFEGKNWATNDTYALTGWGLCNGVGGDIKLENINTQSCKEFCYNNKGVCTINKQDVCNFDQSMCSKSRKCQTYTEEHWFKADTFQQRCYDEYNLAL